MYFARCNSREVVVGTRPTLPIKGVSLLLGNDVAGGRVVGDPKVTFRGPRWQSGNTLASHL